MVTYDLFLQTHIYEKDIRDSRQHTFARNFYEKKKNLNEKKRHYISTQNKGEV